MEKPQKENRTAYDYHQAATYMEYKHGVLLRDMGQRFWGAKNRDAPYRDFWHYVIHMDESISNGSYFTMDSEWLTYEKTEEWQREIVQWFLDEFGEPNDYVESSITFWVEW